MLIGFAVYNAIKPAGSLVPSCLFKRASPNDDDATAHHRKATEGFAGRDIFTGHQSYFDWTTRAICAAH